MNRAIFFTVLFGCFLVAMDAVSSFAATSIYTDRPQFESQFAVTVTDGYEDAGYHDASNPIFSILSDTEMSAVLKETRYATTYRPDENEIILSNFFSGAHMYCGDACSTSFLLDLSQTSVSRDNGVDGFGVDFINYGYDFQHPGLDYSYYAFITFSDGMTSNYKLPTTAAGFNNQLFFGIISDSRITSVHFGDLNGEAWHGGKFAIDNLTIGAIPEPCSFTTFLAALLSSVALGVRTRRVEI